MKNLKKGGGGRKKRMPGDAPTFSTPSTQGQEFEEFVGFARKIVNVPRAEIEEQERLYRESRNLPTKKA